MIVLEIKQNQAGQRLDKFLGKFLPEAPAGFLQNASQKEYHPQREKAEGREVLRQEDQVTLWLADETILKFGGFCFRPKALTQGTGSRRKVNFCTAGRSRNCRASQ